MDRVVVALLEHFEVTTLVSAGDDAFSGTFGFEVRGHPSADKKTSTPHCT